MFLSHLEKVAINSCKLTDEDTQIFLIKDMKVEEPFESLIKYTCEETSTSQFSFNVFQIGTAQSCKFEFYQQPETHIQ